MSIEDTIKERGGQHGRFADNAACSQALMHCLEQGPSYQGMTAVQKTALWVIAHKMARIVCGDPNFKDHWHDIQGYAKLAEDEISGSLPPQKSMERILSTDG